MRPAIFNTDWTAPPVTAAAAEAFPALSYDDKAAGQSADSGSSSGSESAAASEAPVTPRAGAFSFAERAMTIAKAMQSDKAFCRRVNTVRVARWRGKHWQRFNAYMREYQRRYRQRKREA